MNRYKLHLQTYFPPSTLAQVTAESIGAHLADATVQSLDVLPAGGYLIDIGIERPSHAEALTELAAVFERWGLHIVQATVTEMATDWLVGALAGGGIGGTAFGVGTRNVVAGALGSLVGAFVGGLLASTTPKVVVTYRAQRNLLSPGGWHLTELPPETPGGQLNPGWA